MQDKYILVTGATDGIGKQTALALAQAGATVLVHGRNAERGKRVVEEFQRVTGNERVALVLADFSSMTAVRNLADIVKAHTPHLDVLLNNAGVMMKKRVVTEDGFETTFAVNHLAPFLLTHHLLEHIKAAAPARIITVSSTTHHQGRLDFDNLQGEQRFDTYAAYGASKLANVLFANELAERLEGSNVTSNSLHPGVIGTKMLRDHYGMDGDSLEAGAATSLYLATSAEAEGVTGAYFVRQRTAPIAPAAKDKTLQKRLWEVSEELLGDWL